MRFGSIQPAIAPSADCPWVTLASDLAPTTLIVLGGGRVVGSSSTTINQHSVFQVAAVLGKLDERH